MSRDFLTILLNADTSLLASTATVTDLDLKTILAFLSGGAFGSIITIAYNKYKGKIQIMECHYIDDDVISRLPVQVEGGESHANIFSKQFLLKNTTNTDLKEFRVIFEFDIAAKILRHTDITKTGVDKLRKKLLKPNEYSVTIRNFNRKDEVKFIFEIANITSDQCNITEDDCIGFKVKLKDKRKAAIKSKLKLVDKASLSQTKLTNQLGNEAREKIEEINNKLEVQKEFINLKTYIHAGWTSKDIFDNYQINDNTFLNVKVVLNQPNQMFVIYIRVTASNGIKYWLGFSGGIRDTPGKSRDEFTQHNIYKSREVTIRENIISTFRIGFPELNVSPIRVDIVRLRGSDTDIGDITFSYKIE